MTTDDVVIGIDLGTTNSCVALVETRAGGQVDVRVLPNAEGARTTPSVVAFLANGERLVGQAAKRQAVANSELTVYAVKRLMGQKADAPEVQKQAAAVAYAVVPSENGDAWVKIGERTMSPPEVSAQVLASIKATAEAYLSAPVSRAVITVPAYFDDAQRQATKDAGTIAGLEVLRILNEPTAAAIAYGLDQKVSSTIAVYDLGGGTFDISILEIKDGVFNVKAVSGDTHLGGEDFDARLVELLVEGFAKETKVDLRPDRMAMQRVREAAEKAKHELSSSMNTEVNLPFLAMSPETGPIHLERTVSRAELEKVTRDLVERTLEPCRTAFQDAGLSPADIDEVVLVGGMTRMPLVRKTVKEFFEKEPNKSVNPDEVVAAGAALQGAALQGGSENEMLLLDVTPLSLGVETGGGVMTVLIPRNTTIPTEKSEIFTTSVDNQNFVPVHVVQGERSMAMDNRSLTRFELSGIPPAPRGVPQIEVSFHIDANGVVEISAKDLGTKKQQRITVTASSGLSRDEVDRLVADKERFAAEDEARREIATLRSQAETLLYTTEAALEGYKDLVDPDTYDEAVRLVAELKLLVEEDASVMQLRPVHQALEALTFQMAESLYGS